MSGSWGPGPPSGQLAAARVEVGDLQLRPFQTLAYPFGPPFAPQVQRSLGSLDVAHAATTSTATMGLRPGNNPMMGRADEKKMADLHARISQDTFDSAVQENIDEFEMEPEEALADAIQQFETQGVNLSNIIKRVPGAPESDDPPAVLAVRKLQTALATTAESDTAEEEELDEAFGTGRMKLMFMKIETDQVQGVAEAAAELRSECQKDKQVGVSCPARLQRPRPLQPRLRPQCTHSGRSPPPSPPPPLPAPPRATPKSHSRAAAPAPQQLTLVQFNGAVDVLTSTCLSLIDTPSALPVALEALAVIISDAEAREQFGVRGICALSALLRRHADCAPVLTAGFHAARSAMLVHEVHRQQFVSSAGLMKTIVGAMRAHADKKDTFLAACGALRATTLADDMRARTSKGLEHAKAAVQDGVLPLLLAAAQSPIAASSAAALAEIMATVSRLAVTDQIW